MKVKWTDDGLALARRFIEENGYPQPEILIEPITRRIRACGYYHWRKRHIVVDPARCAGYPHYHRQWAWPGYKIDTTPYGVIAHEVGHYIDHCMSSSGFRWSSHLKDSAGEDGLTSYANKNDLEFAAEALKLFITNPTLLEALRPATYDFILYSLKPVETRHWTEVLASAPDRIFNAAMKAAT